MTNEGGGNGGVKRSLNGVDGLWRTIATIMITGFITSSITFAATWISFGMQKANASEVNKNTARIDVIQEQINSIRITLGRLETKLDLLLKEEGIRR